MKYFKFKFVLLLLLLVGLHLPLTSAAADDVVRLATTTSTANSGLLDYLLPEFERHCTCKVHVIAVGTGKALKLGADGNVDVVLVHSRLAEDTFMAAGHGVKRRDVMYNDFVLIGPVEDPARIKGEKSVINAMRKIANSKAKFISRGDDSGTHKMETEYWQQAHVVPGQQNNPRWYFSAGQGMGEVLTMAAEMHAYTLTDRGTYVSYRNRLQLPILMEGDRRMFNPYGIIAVNPPKHARINHQGAMKLIDWITSEQGQARIAAYRVSGEQLFMPAAE